MFIKLNICATQPPKFVPSVMDVGSISNLGAQHFEDTFFCKEKGKFSVDEKGTSLFKLQNLEGTCPQCLPVPRSMPSVFDKAFISFRFKRDRL